MSGAAACTSRNAPWTCISGACARRWSRGSSTTASRPCAARATGSRSTCDCAGSTAGACPARIGGADAVQAIGSAQDGFLIGDPMPRTGEKTSLARLAAVLLGLLVVATLLGALGGFAAEAVALAAVCEIVFLLSRIRHLRRAMIAPSPTAADHRLMIRSRRLSAQLRDLRSAADSLQDAVVLIDPEGHA